MKHLFIVNPAAGKGRTMKLLPEIRKCCENNGFEYELAVTGYPGHATEIAKTNSKAQTLRIYSVGGDGTLNEVLNGMAGSGCSLAAIPGGSGNDFIKSILGADIPKNIIEATINGSERHIDYARVNDKFFINITSLGFDAEVAYRANRFKKLPLVTGEMAYVLGILSSIIIRKNHNMEITIDGFTTSGKSLLAAVGNGRYYGGGMLALPDAQIDDGLFDICHVEEVNRMKMFKLFPKYMKGLHASIKEVHLYRGKKVEIAVDKLVPMNLDGEILLLRKAVFEIFPGSLTFVIPAL